MCNIALATSRDRTGDGGGLSYRGGSLAVHPWVECVATLGRRREIVCVEINPARHRRPGRIPVHDGPPRRGGRVTNPDAHLRAAALALIAGGAAAVVADRRSAADWDRLLAVAGEHVHPWVAWRLANLQLAGSLPVGIAARLHAARRASAAAALRRGDTFARTVRALDAAGVPVVALKSMALAYGVYSEPAARPMADIDLRVEPDRRQAAWDCLASAGRQVPNRYRVLGLRTDSIGWTLQWPGTKLLMEVHSMPDSISARPADDWAQAWARRTRRKVAGVMVNVRATSDQIAHVAIHLVRKHGFANGLRPLPDLTLIAGTITDALVWREQGAPIAQCCAVNRRGPGHGAPPAGRASAGGVLPCGVDRARFPQRRPGVRTAVGS